MSEIQIRVLEEPDAESVIELVMKVFDEFVAPDLSSEGVASFVEWANRSDLGERLRQGQVGFLAVQSDRIVGVIEWASPEHVAMLFVDPATQRRGIGRLLFDASLRHYRTLGVDVGTVRVHASRYAVPFYRAIGFREVSPEQEQDGILFTPMVFRAKP